MTDKLFSYRILSLEADCIVYCEVILKVAIGENPIGTHFTRAFLTVKEGTIQFFTRHGGFTKEYPVQLIMGA